MTIIIPEVNLNKEEKMSKAVSITEIIGIAANLVINLAILVCFWLYQPTYVAIFASMVVLNQQFCLVSNIETRKVFLEILEEIRKM